MKLVEIITSYTGEAKIVLTVPLPRYVLVACCDNTSHVSNRQDPEFLREISGSEKSLSEAAAAGKRTAEARILNVLEFFGPLESPLQELTTVDGASIWDQRDRPLSQEEGPEADPEAAALAAGAAGRKTSES
jgi:hypothetical protein